MGKKKAKAKSRAGSQAAARARDSEDEESESGALSGTSSEKQRLFETRASFGRLSKSPSVWLANSPKMMRLTKMMMMIMMILTPQTQGD
jgi:hypothetical protein